MSHPEPFGPHSPVLPWDRQALAREVLRLGTALALCLPDEVAVVAEYDAQQLTRQHRGRHRALWHTTPAR